MPDLNDLRERYVRPYYLHLLHGNFSARGERALFLDLTAAAAAIDDADLDLLFSTREWRGRMTAAWMVGLARRDRFLPRIGELLLASEVCYAGQGHCAALALLGGPEAERLLDAYLREYLPIGDRYYDQEWAIGALAFLNAGRAERFLAPELWKGKAHDLDPVAALADFRELMEVVQSWRAAPDGT